MSAAQQEEIVTATWEFDDLEDAGAYMKLLAGDGS